MERLRKFRECEICHKSDWPKLYINNVSACIKCHVILEILESLNDFIGKLKDYIELAVRKPKRCCVCNKLDKFENFVKCDTCGGYSCYTHIQRVQLSLSNQQEFKDAKINGNDLFSDICKNCLIKIPNFIIAMFFKNFEVWVNEELKQIKLKKQIEKHNLKELKAMKKMSEKFITNEDNNNEQ